MELRLARDQNTRLRNLVRAKNNDIKHLRRGTRDLVEVVDTLAAARGGSAVDWLVEQVRIVAHRTLRGQYVEPDDERDP